MTDFWITFISVVAVILLIGSAFIIRYVCNRRASRQRMEAANPQDAPVLLNTKSKPAMRDKLHAIIFSIAIFLLIMIARILRLPILEIVFGAFFLLLILFFIRHLFLWHKAKKLGCAIRVGRMPTIILAAFISFGLLFGSVGAVLLHFDRMKQQRCSQFTEAVVVDHLRKRSSRTSSHSFSYYAIVEFYSNGQAIRATSSMGRDGRYKAGKELAIRYNPQDPQEILIKGERNVLPAVFISFGLLFCTGIPILIYTQYDGKCLRQISK